MSERLQHLSKRGSEFLGVEHPIMGGAMSWLSEASLVSAISNAGGFGVIACGSLNPNELEKEIEKTKKLTDYPFGVNLITMHPQLSDLIDCCIEKNISHVVLAGSIPSASSISKLKKAGVKVIGFAPALSLAKRLIKSGLDALVIEGLEAGGHVGPVSTNVLAQEILPNINKVPVFVAGGIGRGEAMSFYLEMGASGVQMGTRFVCANECIAHENFKKAFLRANSRDAVLSIQLDDRFPVIPVRSLKNKGTKLFLNKQKEVIEEFDNGKKTMPEAQLDIEHFWAGALKKAAIDGDIDNGSVMAGQSIGLIKREQSLSEIINEFIIQADLRYNN
ncbi:MAG: Nitronate monooxygenase [Alphaproteobacteria bacterium MarineAlpha2_Bin1]|nr:MAG: Nitronate monooxygenase [Alphaproteobacteria bacterium MarineAlpha2_Bin1]